MWITVGQAARNALKGYTYQHYVFTLFLAKMDAEKRISYIESESNINGNFDDLYIEADRHYRIQVKNYPNTSIEDIVVSEDSIIIKGNANSYDSKENNILIVNTDQINTNKMFMGFKALEIDKLIIIPLTPSDIQVLLDEMFSQESREIQIIQFAFSLTTSSKFSVKQDMLPKLIRISTNLSKNTVLLREPIKKIDKGILWIYGKPGIGKSHYVDMITHEFREATVYRLWTGAQDEWLSKRLQFDTFLDDLALGVFNSPRHYTVEELINEIIDKDKIVIIDGLDHIENYNPKELQKYIDFIDSLKEGRVVVLSRPLSIKVDWKGIELLNWNFDELALYLVLNYSIVNYDIQQKIYNLTQGYPIVTFFIAEHYKLYNEITFTTEITDLSQYYTGLLINVNPKSLLAIFSTNNSFFTITELKNILLEEYIIDAMMDFIERYPYLFDKTLNRISLIHDSFNTYLRNQLFQYPELELKVTEYVSRSLLTGKVDFMARLLSFKLDDNVHDDLLRKYSEFDSYKQLLNTTIDHNSISTFYNQLQKILENREGLLDIYHYYSFTLIYQIVNRNDLIGYDGLVYQILYYLNQSSNVEENIFSSGAIWKMYLLLKLDDERSYKNFLNYNMYDSNQINNLYMTFNDENSYFTERISNPSYDEILERLKSKEIYEFDKQDILIKHLVRIYFNRTRDDKYFKILNEYFFKNKNTAILYFGSMISEFDINSSWSSRILSAVKFQLNEIGDFGTKNIFYGKSLERLIKDTAPNGSFKVAQYAQSYIRLANYQRRSIDIHSINLLWTMYYNRKDQSVHTLDTALIIFEKYGFLDQPTSIDILIKVMGQSEKGIRHLLRSYIDMKDEAEILKLNKNGFFSDDFQLDVFELLPEKINCISINCIKNRLNELLSHHSYGKTIDFNEIENPLLSKYCYYILDSIARHEYKIMGKINNETLENIIAEKGIKILNNSVEKERQYVPFEHGCISQSDFEYIIERKIGYLEISKYTGGWYSCLPFIDIYDHFNIEEIRSNYLKIIHNSLLARVYEREYIGNWYLIIGNIPLFIDKYDIDVIWSQLFDILKSFLKESLIYDLDNRNER